MNTKRLARDERGNAFLMLGAVLITAITAIGIGYSALFMVRTGGSLVDVFQRGAVAETVMSAMKTSVEQATEITVADEHRFVTKTDPAHLPPTFSPRGVLPKTCVVTTFTLAGTSDVQTFFVKEEVHAGRGCDTPVASTNEQFITGLGADSKFEYANRVGHAIQFQGGAAQPFDDTPKPDGVDEQAWQNQTVKTVTLDGTLVQAFGDAPLRKTASAG